MLVRYLILVSMLIVVVCAPVSYGKTADGMTPAEENVCDGLPRGLWGLCVSYCEARDCHLNNPHASQRSCQRGIDTYAKKARKLGFSPLLPCFDVDRDGVDDLIDNCPDVFNPEQVDEDGNGTGDACEEPSEEEPPADEPPAA